VKNYALTLLEEHESASKTIHIRRSLLINVTWTQKWRCFAKLSTKLSKCRQLPKYSLGEKLRILLWKWAYREK